MEPGIIHIVSEIGGCVVGLPPDTEGITRSLRSYASRQCMQSLRLLNPVNQDLGDWAQMAAFAIRE